MPDWKDLVQRHLPSLGLRPEREAEIVEELAQQLEQSYAALLAAGEEESQATGKAIAQMGDWAELAQSIRSVEAPQAAAPALGTPSEGTVWMSGLAGDARYAVRTMRRNPGFSLLSILTLSLGIGGCVSIYSLLNAVVLRPLDYRAPDQLVMVWERKFAAAGRENVISPGNYLDWKSRNRVFSSMSVVADYTVNVTGKGEPEEVRAHYVEPEFLDVLGVHPLLGRPLVRDDARRQSARVALLGYSYWMRKFGGDAGAVGSTLTIDNTPTTIAGVLPQGFRSIGFEPSVLIPYALDPARDYRAVAGRYLMSIARIRDGVSLDRARAEMNAIASDLEREHPRFNKGWGVTLTPLATHFAGQARAALWVLMTAVGLVLLIACSNVANLLLARAAGREREISIRTALGAQRFRIVRQLLGESLLLAFLGGALGSALAVLMVRGLKAIAPARIPRLETAGLDYHALLFALALTVVTGVSFGLVPALATLRTDLVNGLREGAKGATMGPGGRRLRQGLVVAQVALSCVLLVGAGVLLRSFASLLAVQPGFETRSVLTMNISMAPSQDGQAGAMVRLFGRLTEAARTLPGVEAASAITFLPFAGLGSATSFAAEGQPEKHGADAPVTDVRMVEPRFFETMRIPLRAGRWFTDADNAEDAPLRLVISETMAREAFPGQSPLGRKISVSMSREARAGGEVIGVVGDVRLNSLSGSIRPLTYFPMAKLPFGFATLVIRTTGDPNSLVRPMLARIRELYPDQPVSQVRTMHEWVSDSLRQHRFLALLLSGLSALSLALAVVGLYGLLAFTVAQRTREFGVRLALGAAPAQVRLEVMWSGLRLACAGLVTGLAAAALLAPLLVPAVEGVRPADAVSIGWAILLFSSSALLATLVPARRATRVDPVQALREE